VDKVCESRRYLRNVLLVLDKVYSKDNYRHPLVNIYLAVSGPHRQALTAWSPLDVRDVFLRVTCRVKDLLYGAQYVHRYSTTRRFGSIKETRGGIRVLRGLFKTRKRNGPYT